MIREQKAVIEMIRDEERKRAISMVLTALVVAMLLAWWVLTGPDFSSSGEDKFDARAETISQSQRSK